MRLLFVTERFPPAIGGVAASASRIAHSIAALGHTVDVFHLTRDLPSGAVDSRPVEPRRSGTETSSGVTVHRMGTARHSDFTLQQALLFLEWKQRREPWDAIWAHYVAQSGFLATWFGRQEQIPVILSVRGNDLDRQLFPPGDFARLTWCLEQSQLIVTVSQDLARKVAVLSNRSAVVLPNSVHLDLFSPRPKDPALITRYAIQPSEFVVGFSGELRAKKGLSFLLPAFQELTQRQPARLLIIGAVRPGDRGEFERHLAADSVGSKVIVTGHLSEPARVADHLRLADALVVPSLWDGMPNSVLESMAAGVPVIGSDAGAIPELIEHHVTGILVPRSHLHRLADVITEFAQLPSEQKTAITSAARQRVTQHHSPAAELQRLAEILAQLRS
ncbi:MAG: glycosyltransferase [Planctomycetota bacterium]